MMLWRLAWRNLWRHRTRTLIVISAIVFSYAMLLLFLGLQDDLERGLEETAVETAGGHLFIHAQNYWETLDVERLIADPEPVIAAVDDLPGLRAWAPRVVVQGLAETADDSVAIQLSGIDLEREQAIFDPAQHLVEGQFFDDDIDDPIVVGRGVADRLGVTIGDRVIVTAATPDGEVGRALFHLSGIIETGVREADDRLAYSPLSSAQAALEIDDQYHEIALLLHDGDQRHHSAEALNEQLAEVDHQTLVIRAWDELLPDILTMMEFRRSLAYLIFFALLLVVAMAITNTFMMAVMERLREFGLMSAMGLTPRRISAMVLYESLILGALGLAIGFALGLGLNLWLGAVGIDVANFLGGDGDFDIGGVPLIDLVVRSHIVPWRWVVSTLFVAFIVLASSMYPAVRASRLSPAEAMRMNE